MHKLKQIRKWIPECYLLASAVFFWIFTATLLNPFAIILVAVLLALFKWKSKTLGVIVSFMFLILSFYMVLALLSELSKFPTFSTEVKLMLGVGGAWLGLNITLACWMLIKWAKHHSCSGVTVNNQEALFA